jgi:hypothetical protein
MLLFSLNVMDTVLEKYIEAVNKDLEINQFNVKQIQMGAPARKHFWVSRLINTKIELNHLKSKKKKLKNDVISALLHSAPTKISQASLSNAAEKNPKIQDLTDKIVELETLVEYLDHVVRIVGNLHWEIKNIIELMQMELQ